MSIRPPIRSAAVLGAGTMGAQIAAHLANAGVRTLLLDLTVEIAREGLKRALALRPDPFFTTDAAALITVGGLDRDLGRLAEVDWIIEAVVEQIDVKRGFSSASTPSDAPTPSRPRTRPAFPSPPLRRAEPTTSSGTGSAPTSSTRRDICACSK